MNDTPQGDGNSILSSFTLKILFGKNEYNSVKRRKSEENRRFKVHKVILK